MSKTVRIRKWKRVSHLPKCNCYYGVRSMGEVAALMGLSRERVRQLLMSALAKLRKSPILKEWADHQITKQRDWDDTPEIGIGA